MIIAVSIDIRVVETVGLSRKRFASVTIRGRSRRRGNQIQLGSHPLR
jgi:hypothetical protein